MFTYAFILGRKNLLSTAELCAVLGLSNLPHDTDQETTGAEAKIADITTEALIANFNEPLQNVQTSLNRLGGVIKIAEIFHEESVDKADLAPVISQYLIDNFKDQSGKLIYGLSLFSFPQNHEIILRKSLNNIKKILKSEDLKSRFINHNFKNLESAAIKGEKLLEKGAEIIAIKGHHKIFMGKTIALQDFEAYSHRDFDRPERDPRLGMLPPKVAQIMINLGGLTSLEEPATHSSATSATAPKPTGASAPFLATKTLYDPFCGMGTIPAEGLLMGYSVLGSDIGPEIVGKAQQNIEWLRNNNFSPYQKIRLFQKDATALTQADLYSKPANVDLLPGSPTPLPNQNSWPTNIDLVVTESYLGPPVSQIPLQENITKNFNTVRDLVLRFFLALSKILKPGTPVIISVPVYRSKGRLHYIPDLVEKICDNGFKTEILIPKEYQTKFNLPVQERDSLVYDRPDQIVGREIWKFVKT